MMPSGRILGLQMPLGLGRACEDLRHEKGPRRAEPRGSCANDENVSVGVGVRRGQVQAQSKSAGFDGYCAGSVARCRVRGEYSSFWLWWW